VQHRLDNDAAMLAVLEGSSAARLEDPIRIESTLQNASLDGCKKSLLALHSSDDDANDGGQEC
jgi:hypothetical protein